MLKDCSFKKKCTKVYIFNVSSECKLEMNSYKLKILVMVPTVTRKTGKPGKMGDHFPVREKSGNFANMTPYLKYKRALKKYRKTEKYWKSRGNFSV